MGKKREKREKRLVQSIDISKDIAASDIFVVV